MCNILCSICVDLKLVHEEHLADLAMPDYIVGWTDC